MSYQLLKQDVLFYQRFLKSAGFYKDTLDGDWGPNTDKADADFVAETASIMQRFGAFDSRSEASIITLLPKAQVEARKFLQIAKEHHKDVRIISGTRTYQEQDVLYGQGRFGNSRPIVTNAKGGQSNHNFGIAWDIGVFNKGTYSNAEGDYTAFSSIALGEINSIEWGGNWHSFKDFPHYQLRAVSDDVVAIRHLFEAGDLFV